MLRVWSKYRNFEPENESTIRKEALWLNNKVGPGPTGLHWQAWQEKGIKTVGDICHSTEDRLMSHSEISEKFNVRCSFLDALSIRASIPMKWKRSLTNNWQSNPRETGLEIKLNSDQPEDLNILGSKRMYSKILSGHKQDSAALRRWKEGDDGLQVANDLEWSEICTRTFRTNRETKHQSLQYKVLHRIIPCRTFLKRLRICETDECQFCQTPKRDSIAHFFFQCEVVRMFWLSVCAWFQAADNLYLSRLSAKEFIFGVPKKAHRSRMINTILTHVRSYIHRQKLFYSANLELLPWLREFRQRLKVDEWICARTAKKKHSNIWTTILKELG